MQLDLEHLTENRRQVSAARKCLEDDPATLDQATVFLCEAYDALGDTGPLTLGVPGGPFQRLHDCVERALLKEGGDGASDAGEMAGKALRRLEFVLAMAAKSRGRRERLLSFVVVQVLVVVFVGAYAIVVVTSDLVSGPSDLLDISWIAFGACLLFLAVFGMGPALRRKWRRSPEPIAEAPPASEDYWEGRWKPLDGMLARLDYGPAVRAVAQRAVGDEEPLHRFWAVVEVAGTRRKRLVVATRSRLWIVDHSRLANTGTVSHTITYPEITGFEKRVFSHRIHVSIDTRDGPVWFRWGSAGTLCREQADALAIILRRRSHLPPSTVSTRKRFSWTNLQRIERSSTLQAP